MEHESNDEDETMNIARAPLTGSPMIEACAYNTTNFPPSRE